jgi:hypothetical protein
MADNWQAQLEEQRQRMDAITPPSEQVAKLKAMIRLDQIRSQSEQYGSRLRGARPQVGISDILKHYSSMDVPTRSTTVTLPGLKQAGALEYFSRPIVHKIRLSAAEAARIAEEKMTEPPTDDPESMKFFQPAKYLTVGKGIASGWKQKDEEIAAGQRASMAKKVDEAKKMFEESLRAEYQNRQKVASAPELVDQLADCYVKRGFANLDSLLQAYTTGGTILGAGAHQAAKDYVKEVDPREMRLRAMKELLHQRTRQRPPVVRVEVPSGNDQDKVDAETASKV